jgi:hypothetical protein
MYLQYVVCPLRSLISTLYASKQMQPLSNERPDVRSPIVNFRNGIDPENNKMES